MSCPVVVLCAVAALWSGVAGVRHDVNKRSDDPSPLEAVVQQHSSDLDDIRAQLSAMQTRLNVADRQVAFFAQYSTSEPAAQTNGPFRFDSVLLNDGNGYDPMQGIFTAPVAGVYTFSAQFFTYGRQTTRPLLDVKVNGNTYVRLAFEASPQAQAQGSESDSTTLWVKLQTGDTVWMQDADDGANALWGLYHSFFSGALLYAV